MVRGFLDKLLSQKAISAALLKSSYLFSIYLRPHVFSHNPLNLLSTFLLAAVQETRVYNKALSDFIILNSPERRLGY